MLLLDLVGKSEADLEEGPGGPWTPRYFWTKLRPERSKKNFKKAPPYLRVWMIVPAPVSYTHLTLPTIYSV